jgi:hypothetical protein
MIQNWNTAWEKPSGSRSNEVQEAAGRCVYGVAGDSLAASTEVLRRDADVRWEELSDENRDSRPTDGPLASRPAVIALWDWGKACPDQRAARP